MKDKDFDKLLVRAFGAYAKEEFGEIPLGGDEYPMPKRELKWAKEQDRIRRYGRPVWQVNLRRCAAAVLVLCSVCAAVLASSVEVRAAVREFFSDWFNSFINIFYAEEEETDGDIYLYDVTYIPDGFEESEKHEDEKLRRYIYASGESKLTVEIAFTRYATVVADSRLNGYEEVWLGSHSAYVLYDGEEGSGAAIFGDGDITVSVEGDISREELIRVVKGVNTDEADILGYVRRFSGHTASLPNVATYIYDTSVINFSFADTNNLESPFTVGFRIPETWSDSGANSCEKLLPDLSGFQIASGSSVFLYEVSSDFILDSKFHETQEHKYAIPFSTFEGKKISEYRTEGGFDSVIYYQYDDADNIFLTAFIRLTDTLIMKLDLNDDSGNAAVMLDILDSIKLGAYEEPEREDETAVRFNFDKLNDTEKEIYLKLEKGEYAGGETFSGDDARAVRTAVKLYRINNHYKSWRDGFLQYSAYVPDHTKDEIILRCYEVDGTQSDWYNNCNERLYDLKRDVLKHQMAEFGNEYEKVEFIAGYLYKNIIQTEREGGSCSISIGALYAGRADCNGIAYAFEELCKSVGVEVTTVHSVNSPGHYLTNDFLPHDHTWNMVSIDGNWYHVDVSRMLSDRNNEDPFAAYFLISDDVIREENGEFGLMLYGDEIESPAFEAPEASENYCG